MHRLRPAQQAADIALLIALPGCRRGSHRLLAIAVLHRHRHDFALRDRNTLDETDLAPRSERPRDVVGSVLQFVGEAGTNAVWNIPFYPAGSGDGKVTAAVAARSLSLWDRFGRADGAPFDAEQFLALHPQWNWQADYLRRRPSQPWTVFGGAS
jgi:hypothetical protein